MHKIQWLILIFFGILSALGYAYIFSDSGLLVHSNLDKRKTELREEINQLEKENTELNQKYYEVVKNERAPNDDQENSTILKFEETENTSVVAYSGAGITEMRTVYVISMIFLTLAALTASGYIMKRQTEQKE